VDDRGRGHLAPNPTDRLVGEALTV
jgi:hypothetical protein